MAKVLVVEDNELNMKLFHDLLSILNCEVVSSRTGVGAVDFCRKSEPDIILMDIQLDGISGIDLIKEIKADRFLKSIPLIAISAYAMKHEEVKILQSGCDKYMQKPLSIDEFFSTIKHYLGRLEVE